MHFLVKVLLVLLKHLLPELELAIDILLIIIDEGGLNVKIILSEWLKRTYVVGVTIVTYILKYKSRMRRPEEVRILNPPPIC